MNTKMNLEEKVQQWFVDRNLHEANPVKQFLKLMEESGELFEGIAKDKSELIYDALGDIQVVLIGLDQQIKNGAQIQANQQELELLLMVSSLGNIAQKLYAHICHNETQIPLIKSDLMFLDSVVSTVSFCNGTTAESCLEEAYEVIKDRKGKMIEGMLERDKVTIPQFVAEYIEESRLKGWDLLASMCFVLNAKNKKTTKWFYLGENKNIFALAWIFGYTVEVDEEKKYKITLLNRNDGDLYLINQNAGVSDKYGHFSPVVLLFTKGTNFSEQCYTLTKKEVASNGFGWVFNSPGFQIEEVE